MRTRRRNHNHLLRIHKTLRRALHIFTLQLGEGGNRAIGRTDSIVISNNKETPGRIAQGAALVIENERRCGREQSQAVLERDFRIHQNGIHKTRVVDNKEQTVGRRNPLGMMELRLQTNPFPTWYTLETLVFSTFSGKTNDNNVCAISPSILTSEYCNDCNRKERAHLLCDRFAQPRQEGIPPYSVE